KETAKFTAGVITSEKNAFGYNYVVNRNGLAWHYWAGRGTGALPNGRKAGAPFNDGSLSPMPGLDREGPTALLNSALKADYTDAAAAILNVKFPLVFVKSAGANEKVASMVEMFMKNGGTHIQFNFLDKEVLLDAKKRPDKYRDLVVRVAGYSAFFVSLTPEVQDEIIARTEQWM
ncbi:MAG: glycine radical domain-containing protein, partial [Dehalococcoidales bacterium]|nr:glycine radical domain-containing protein [Dehalococcoidales bacterium]